MVISPLILMFIVFAGVLLFITGVSYYLGSGTKFESAIGTFGKIPVFGSIFPTSKTTTTQSNQTKCKLSGGECLPVSPVSPLKCKLEFLDEAFCGKGMKCCIPR